MHHGLTCADQDGDTITNSDEGSNDDDKLPHQSDASDDEEDNLSDESEDRKAL